MTNIGTLFQILFLLSLSLVSLGKKAQSTSLIFNDINFKTDTIRLSTNAQKSHENQNDKPMIVVIDAGHGGHDQGCAGSNSIEKEITLKISFAIGKYLESASPDIKVIYTRKNDCFVPLYERIALASRLKSDLFISIHANSYSDKNVKGTEVFVMGLHSASENLEVAKRENSSIKLEQDYGDHYGGFDPDSPEGQIILSMVQNIHLEKSIDFAYRISSKIKSITGLKNRGVKQAGFVILKNATMPSILIETGFLSNPEDEKILLSKEGQMGYAQTIAEAIISYKKENDQENRQLHSSNNVHK